MSSRVRMPCVRCISLVLVSAFGWSGCSEPREPQPRPQPPSGLAAVALSHTEVAWDSLPAAGYTTYVARGTYTPAHAEQLHQRSGQALRSVLAILGEPTYPAHLRLFYLPSRDEMLSIVGESYTGTADVEAHTVLLVENQEWEAFAKHEVMHAVSLLLWGEPGAASNERAPHSDAESWRRGGWLREGLAVAAEDRCGRFSNRGATATMLAEGVLLPWRTLMDAFHQQDDLIAYLQAGSMIGFLLENYGRDRFRRVWRGETIAEAYGSSVHSMEAEWIAWLRSTPAELRPASTAALRRAGCG